MSFNLRIEILRGDRATATLANPEFRRAWLELYESCPWATVCQSWEFCTAWYEAYARTFSPVIVTGAGPDGETLGLLFLGVSKDSGALVHAGDHQAEYQVWISRPEAGNSFIEAALDALREEFPDQSLRFLFLPAGTPLAWLNPQRPWGNRCELRKLERPLMSLADQSRLKASLRNKKHKINRLRKKGNLEFRQVREPRELEAIFDEVMVLANLRLEAAQGVATQADPLKREFYLRMMQARNLLHVTLMTLDGILVSANIDVWNRGQLLLGVTAFSPHFARYSPGTLHLLFLAEALAEQHIAVFDLTPGGFYKDRLATHADEVHVLTVFFRRSDHLRHMALRKAVHLAKRFLQAAGIPPERVKSAAQQIRPKLRRLTSSHLPGEILRGIKRQMWSAREYRIYRMEAEVAKNLPSPEWMNRDKLSDLMAFEPVGPWPSRSDFLRGAVSQLEAGARVYTRVAQGRLVHCAWLLEDASEAPLPGVPQKISLPPGSRFLFPGYTHPEANPGELWKASLSQMVRDTAQGADTKHIYAGVLADDALARRALEELPFVYQYSFFERKRWGKGRKWSNAPAAAAGPEGTPDQH